MDKMSDLDRFRNLSFEDFKNMAKDDSLSMYGKIGFPDSYRSGKEEAIFHDIVSKIKFNEKRDRCIFLDIGPGCSELPQLLIKHCLEMGSEILLVDSQEMLDQLSTGPFITKFEGYFPDNVPELINRYQNSIDYIVGYSIFHYVFYNTCIFKFLDVAVSLLKPGGKLLLGDIPNISKRKRFFSTEAGIAFHQQFTQSNTLPPINHQQLEPTHLDDGVLLGIIQRYRNFGFEAYLLPQPKELPMSNRREDLLIQKY